MTRMPTESRKSLRIQSILYNSDFADLRKAALNLAKAVEVSKRMQCISQATLVWGDCSPERCVSQDQLVQIRSEIADWLKIEYRFFNSNLGSARGHNTLFEGCLDEFVIILNPDVLMAPSVIAVLVECFDRPDVGMAEARQIPIEHPKSFDQKTGETSWASTCCAMIPSELFLELGGFDAESFFLYCDDVDFSWRVRAAGKAVIYQPAAVVFHDKRLSSDAKWMSSAAERYYSAEAALLLAYKWSRNDYLEKVILYFNSHYDEYTSKALNEFERRKREGRLPDQIDRDNKIGQFIDGNYAHHRFSL